MNIVTLRVKGFNKRKDFHFTITEEAAKFQEYMEKLDKGHKLTYEVLAGEINNNTVSMRELARKPENYALSAWNDFKGTKKK